MSTQSQRERERLLALFNYCLLTCSFTAFPLRWKREKWKQDSHSSCCSSRMNSQSTYSSLDDQTPTIRTFVRYHVSFLITATCESRTNIWIRHRRLELKGKGRSSSAWNHQNAVDWKLTRSSVTRLRQLTFLSSDYFHGRFRRICLFNAKCPCVFTFLSRPRIKIYVRRETHTHIHATRDPISAAAVAIIIKQNISRETDGSICSSISGSSHRPSFSSLSSSRWRFPETKVC